MNFSSLIHAEKKRRMESREEILRRNVQQLKEKQQVKATQKIKRPVTKPTSPMQEIRDVTPVKRQEGAQKLINQVKAENTPQAKLMKLGQGLANVANKGGKAIGNYLKEVKKNKVQVKQVNRLGQNLANKNQGSTGLQFGGNPGFNPYGGQRNIEYGGMGGSPFNQEPKRRKENKYNIF